MDEEVCDKVAPQRDYVLSETNKIIKSQDGSWKNADDYHQHNQEEADHSMSYETGRVAVYLPV